MAVVKSKFTIQELIHKGLPITPGSKYIPKSWIPKRVLSLAQIRRRLAKIKGSLAETVAEIRKEE